MAEYSDNEKIVRALAADDFGDDDFDLDSFPAASDRWLALEAELTRDELAALEGELVELGTIGGRCQRADGVPAAEAIWRAVPEGTRVRGKVWNLFWLGIQAAYAEG